MTVVSEALEDGLVPMVVHPVWRERFPWLLQGVTTPGRGSEPADFRLFGPGPSGTAMERWRSLLEVTGFQRAVHGRQVHGTRCVVHAEGAPGLQVMWGVDGHATRTPDVLLAVSLADCVPIFLVAPERRVVALMHAGWRGVAAGALERSLEVLADRLAVSPGELEVHLGPGICGSCYEVGPEVHQALGEGTPSVAGPLDLRAVLARRVMEAGVRAGRLTLSRLCTRCRPDLFFSHRRGDNGRQLGVVGIRGGPGNA